MNISVVDASNYFKGLLLLIRKDRKVTELEIELMMRIGKALGFNPEFCQQSIDGVLENTHIKEQPPRFTTKELAMMFVQDGFTLAYSDSKLDPAEEEWLKFVAEINGLDVQWFIQERQRASKEISSHPRLHVEGLTAGELLR
jgi:hypothetical protein